MSGDVLSAVRQFEKDLVRIRREIHAHPETGFEEVRTAKLVAEQLKGFGLEVHEGIARTGVVGVLQGRHPGARAIALRADMDALHIHEQSGVPHCSTEPGKMHACGHDGHTTMLLGAARYLAAHPDFAGRVHFIFQPAEEQLGGGRAMVNEGLFSRFPCDAVYGMHIRPGAPAGHFSTKVGPMFAAGDTWTATFRGTGGHGGSTPHLSTDPTVPLAHFVLGVQTIIGRNIAASDTAVLSVGHIAAGAYDAPNVIPAVAIVRGTARSYQPAVRDILEKRLGELAGALAAAHNCEASVEYQRGYPPVINHAEQVAIALSAATAVAGADKVDGQMLARTASDDFAFMLEARPGAFMMIGNGIGTGGRYHNVHTPRFDFNDEILSTGVCYWVELVRQELGTA
jgi:hippurate hydrolase